jgi:hypothetical protein
LCLGAILGAILLTNRWLPLDPRLSVIKSSHVQMLIVGWLTQLIMGVAWWLFPPMVAGLRSDAPLPIRRGQQQRGSEWLFWVTFACLNAGLLLAVVFEPLYNLTRNESFGFLAGISGLLLAVAAVTFVANMWQRVRELGRGKKKTPRSKPHDGPSLA